MPNVETMMLQRSPDFLTLCIIITMWNSMYIWINDIEDWNMYTIEINIINPCKTLHGGCYNVSCDIWVKCDKKVFVIFLQTHANQRRFTTCNCTSKHGMTSGESKGLISLITRPREWLSFRRFTSKQFCSWSWWVINVLAAHLHPIKDHARYPCPSSHQNNELSKVDRKAMIRNRYNRIPYPALNTKRERDIYN